MASIITRANVIELRLFLFTATLIDFCVNWSLFTKHLDRKSQKYFLNFNFALKKLDSGRRHGFAGKIPQFTANCSMSHAARQVQAYCVIQLDVSCPKM